MFPSCRSALSRIALIALAAAVVPALADPPEGKGKNRNKPHPEARGESSADAGALVVAGITAAVAHRLALDAGVRMGGYKPLPPGIRKNLARGKPLPPGIAKKAAPSAMLGRLPHHPGYEWRTAGTDLVLVQIGTAIVADVLRDVFR